MESQEPNTCLLKSHGEPMTKKVAAESYDVSSLVDEAKQCLQRLQAWHEFLDSNFFSAVFISLRRSD